MKSKNQQVTQIKEHLLSTARAIGADDSIHIEFAANQENNFFTWNQDLIVGEKTIASPTIKAGDEESFIGSAGVSIYGRHLGEGNIAKQARASIDLGSCYLMFHDPAIHQAKDFMEQDEQDLFDFFEKIRVTSCVKDSYLGIAKNILEKIEDDILEGDLEAVSWNETGNLPLLLLAEIFPKQTLPRTNVLIGNLQAKLDQRITDKIKELSHLISKQEGFASNVQEILELLKDIQQAEENEENQEDKQEEGNAQMPQQEPNFGQETVDMESEKSPVLQEDESTETPQKEEKKITEFQEDEEGGSIQVKAEENGFEQDKIEFKNAYKIFTSKFDEVVFPQKLVQKNDLELLRDQLDLKMVKLNAISKSMSLKLKRKLMAKKNAYIQRDNSSGVLDRKKFTQFVLDPFIEDIWIDNRQREYQDTALTILLDNSGSMRGNPIVMSALACEIIAGILEKFSIKTEIIGFTTADWKGGRARKMWEGMGKPDNPGRLNELRHIIYKSANQSFKKARVNLGLMLKEGILKENIDGEALLFAKARLMQRDEKRKILMVISDGTPIDDSTNSTNSEDILSDHLHHAINKIEKQSKIEIVGVGIGHDTNDFYHNSITIKKLEELGDVMIEKLADLL